MIFQDNPIARSLSLNPRAMRSWTLAATLVALANTGLAHAQMVNDPSETIIFNAASPFGKTQTKNAAEVQARTENSDAGTGKVTEEKVQPLPPELQPELDMQKSLDEEAAAPPAGDALQAKAVMVDINSNTLNYDKDRDVYIATGSVHMVISEQNSELYADKLTYDQNQELVIAEGNVTIVKNGQRTHGSYAKIDLSRKSALINDYLASVEQVRIKAKNALVSSKYLQYENGRIIIDPQMLRQAVSKRGPQQISKKMGREKSEQAAAPAQKFTHDEDITRLGVSRELEKTDLSDEDDLSAAAPRVTENTDSDGVKKSSFQLKMKEIDVYRSQSGYNRIIGRWPSLYFKGHKIGTMPSTEFSFDQPSGTLEYLGPDIGYDPDYGGFYYGPGWDFRAGEHGSIRFSPLLSYGGNGRRLRGGARFKDMGRGPGIGGIVHYRDPKTTVDFGYNTRVDQPVLLAQRKLGTGKTNLLASVNEDYINGFLGYERPGYGTMIYDNRRIKDFGNFYLDSFASAGWFKDEFFPNYDREHFVQAKADKPGTAGRAQIQLELNNRDPLLQVGKVMSLGFRGNAMLAGYTTGDFVGMVRGGPSLDINLGNRYSSNLRYYYVMSAGDTPFVFDSYYRGRQNLIWNNAFKVNKYLTLGLRSDMSLTRNNAKNALFTGNQVYMLVGPKEVKMNLAFDVIRKRSYFGLNFYPGEDSNRAIDFEKMRIFQPEQYSNPVIP